jgi:hypothetical protein
MLIPTKINDTIIIPGVILIRIKVNINTKLRVTKIKLPSNHLPKQVFRISLRNIPANIPFYCQFINLILPIWRYKNYKTAIPAVMTDIINAFISRISYIIYGSIIPIYQPFTPF